MALSRIFIPKPEILVDQGKTMTKIIYPYYFGIYFYVSH